MRMMLILMLLAFAAYGQQQKGSFTDARDKKEYKTVKIGSQTWMAENLDYAGKGSKCGGTIPKTRKEEMLLFGDIETITITYYSIEDKNTENCNKYGRLYNWETAKKICPNGWHLPTDAEWDKLIAAAGGRDKAGKKLKAKSGWEDYVPCNRGKYYDGDYRQCEVEDNAEERPGSGTDDYGFAALPGGYGSSNGDFKFAGYDGNWWSASESVIGANNEDMSCTRDFTNHAYASYSKLDLFSVRCVKD